MGIEARIDLDVSPLKAALKAVQQSFMDIASASGTMAGKVSAAFDKITNDVQKSSGQQSGGKAPIKLLEVFKSLKDEIKKVSDSKFSIPSITGMLQNENMTKSLIGSFQGLGRSLQTVTYILRGQFSSALNTGARAMALIGSDALLLITGATIFTGSLLSMLAIITGVGLAVKRFGEVSYRAIEVGMSASQLKPIELAFEKVGGKAEDAVPALQSFITKLSQARFGSGEVATALRQLSIASGKDLRPIELLKKGNKEALLEVLDALKQVKNEAQRGQIASTLFTGKSGAEIKAIVDTGSLGDAESMLGNVTAITEAWGGTFMNIKSAIVDTFSAIKEGVFVVLASFGTMFNMSAKIFKEWQMGKTIANIFADIAMFIGAIGMVLDPIIGLFSMLVGIILRMVEAVAYLFAVLGRGVALLMSTLLSILTPFLWVIDKIFGTDLAQKWGDFAGQTEEKKPGAPAMPVEAFKPVQAGIASSLTKIGGGGETFGGGGENLYDLNRQQLEVQKQIRDSLRQRQPASNSEQSYQYAVPAYM